MISQFKMVRMSGSILLLVFGLALTCRWSSAESCTAPSQNYDKHVEGEVSLNQPDTKTSKNVQAPPPKKNPPPNP